MREGVFEDSIFISQVAVRISVWEFYFPTLNDNVWGFIHKEGDGPRVSDGTRRDHGHPRCRGWPPDAALANHEPPECEGTSQSTSWVHRGPTNIGPAHDPHRRQPAPTFSYPIGPPDTAGQGTQAAGGPVRPSGQRKNIRSLLFLPDFRHLHPSSITARMLWWGAQVLPNQTERLGHRAEDVRVRQQVRV